MSSRGNVMDFFLAIDSQNSLLNTAKALIELASTEEVSQVITEAFSAVQARLKDKERPIITQKQTIVYERLHRSNRYLEEYEIPDFVESLLIIMYLRAKVALQAVGSKPLFQNYEENFKKVMSTVDALPDDFFGELIVEAEIRANSDTVFAKTLNIAAKEIATLEPQFEVLKEQGMVLFQRQRQNGRECSCVAVGCNNRGDCQEFCLNWWQCVLLFLSIIIVIIISG